MLGLLCQSCCHLMALERQPLSDLVLPQRLFYSTPGPSHLTVKQTMKASLGGLNESVVAIRARQLTSRHKAPGVVTQVQHQRIHVLGLQRVEGPGHR